MASLVGSLCGEEEATHDEKWIINNGAGCELGLFWEFYEPQMMRWDRDKFFILRSKGAPIWFITATSWVTGNKMYTVVFVKDKDKRTVDRTERQQEVHDPPDRRWLPNVTRLHRLGSTGNLW